MSPVVGPLATTVTVVAALSAGAAPALAGAPGHHSDPAKSKTPLVAKIEASPLKGTYQLNGAPREVESGVTAVSNDVVNVGRVSADSAQLPAKLEWVTGAEEDVAGSHHLLSAMSDEGAAQRASGARRAQLRAAGDTQLRLATADYRLTNYYVAQADTTLGIPHPAIEIEPYYPGKNPPASAHIPTAPPTVGSSLTATITFATPVIKERIPERVSELYRSSMPINVEATHYYWLSVSRMHTDADQRPAQREWVEGVHTQQTGDDLLARGSDLNGSRVTAAGTRDINAGLETLRRADSEISHADAQLGLPNAGVSASLPAKVIYTH